MDNLIASLKRLFPEPLHPRLFLVGGMVRDILLGVPCQDIDLAAAISPNDLAALGFRLVESKSTPDIYFRFGEDLGKVEVTRLPSAEALLKDLKRRDFTINAMAMTFDRMVYDPLGGQKDLENKVLRTCSAASFSDDPARIFRAFRFESDGWRLDRDAEAAISERDWSIELGLLPVERFSQEMLKSLAKRDPTRFFKRMLEFGIGELFLPELFKMTAIPAGPAKFHPEGDLLAHSMQVLQRTALATFDPTARFCALFHDLGKLSTPNELYPKHHGHDRAGFLAAEPFCRRLRLPLVVQRAVQATNRLHTTANRWGELKASTRIQLALDALKAGIATSLPLIVAADCGESMPGWDAALRVASLNTAQLGIDPAALEKSRITPEACRQLIMERRVEVLRKG